MAKREKNERPDVPPMDRKTARQLLDEMRFPAEKSHKEIMAELKQRIETSRPR